MSLYADNSVFLGIVANGSIKDLCPDNRLFQPVIFAPLAHLNGIAEKSFEAIRLLKKRRNTKSFQLTGDQFW